MSCTAIIVAAGSSRRMGFDKLLAPLGGLPVLAQTLGAFDRCDDIDHIICVTDAERFATCNTEFFNTRVTRVDGGVERHHSVANGLAEVADSCEFIAVHDGARPLISPSSISLCLATAREVGAATCARRITETVKRGDDEDLVAEAVSRENLWAMETPQIFRASLLRQAYDSVLASGALVTDEVSALEHIGIRTRLVAHGQENPKITFPEDIAQAERLISNLRVK